MKKSICFLIIIVIITITTLVALSNCSSASVTVIYQNSKGDTVSENVDFMSSFLSQSACQFLMLIYPSYASFKAIRSKRTEDDKQWLMYWIIISFVHCVEYFLVTILVWVPFYWEIKLVLLLWLQAPQTRGACTLYYHYVRPFLKANEDKIDAQIASVEETVSSNIVSQTRQIKDKIVDTIVNEGIVKVSEGITRQLKKSDKQQ